MKNNFFIDLIPLIIFFAVYYFTKDIFYATAGCIVASWAQLIWYKLKYNKISNSLLINTILITVFGLATIGFHNKTFIMIKPTALYWIIAGSMLIGPLFGKNFIQLTLGQKIHLKPQIWKNLNIAWGLFFITMGIINLIVAFNYSEYFWIKFKVFGMPIFIVIFGIASSLYVYYYDKTHPNHPKR